MKNRTIHWLDAVEPDDFEAGRRYLELLYPATMARSLVRALESTRIEEFVAKDILRASELDLLDAKDPAVARQLRKVRKGEPLSPLLLVRERGGRARLVVADGFHRLCAAMHLDENALVRCKIG